MLYLHNLIPAVEREGNSTASPSVDWFTAQLSHGSFIPSIAVRCIGMSIKVIFMKQQQCNVLQSINILSNIGASKKVTFCQILPLLQKAQQAKNRLSVLAFLIINKLK